jgi:glucuronokinase
MIHQTRAFARAGLIGNPSDGYYGKTISVICRNFSARVALYESPRLAIRPQRCDRLEYDDIDDMIGDVDLHGYYGGVRLIKAAIKRFHDHCRQRGLSIGGRNFTVEYESDIPVRVGLAGSSAIVTATIRALMDFFRVEIPRYDLPNLTLSVEVGELGIGAGLQDRVIQVYEGAVFMDFGRAHMEATGHGVYEPLAPSALPPIFIAYHGRLAEGTEVTHNDLRDRYIRGDREVHAAMERFAGLAQGARDLILAGRGIEIGPLLDEGFDLRARICSISDGNRRLVQIGRECGASTQFAGSGGAIVGTWDGDPERFARLRSAYEDFGAKILIPRIDGAAKAASEFDAETPLEEEAAVQ